MVGIEWVIHTSVLQAVTENDFVAQQFLFEVLNHQKLAVDSETGQIYQQYVPFFTKNRFLFEWFQKMVKTPGKIQFYKTQPLDNKIKDELQNLNVSPKLTPFINVAQQTLDQLIASDELHFTLDVQTYLQKILAIKVITDLDKAVQRGQPLSRARVKQLISQGEGETIEFKESLKKARQKEAIETLAAFSTKNGGHVLFGIQDNGIICGVQTGKHTFEDLAYQIMSNTNPSLIAPYLRIEAFEFDEKTVVVVSVDAVHRQCRAYDRLCHREGKRTQREPISNLNNPSS